MLALSGAAALRRGDARFDDAVRFMEWVSEDFDHKFTIEGDEVLVTGRQI